MENDWCHFIPTWEEHGKISRTAESGFEPNYPIFLINGTIRVFQLKSVDFFYYLINAGEFSYSNDMHQPPLVAYLERNSLFNFDKMVFGYIKTPSAAHLFFTGLE